MTEETSQETSKQQMDSYLYNVRAMNKIVEIMREIPVLPSDAPQEIFPLIKVMFPEKGGVLTFMDKHIYPYKGFPAGSEFVEKIDILKKLGRGTLSNFYHQVYKKNKWKIVFLLPVLKDIFRITVNTAHKFIERFRVKTDKYCDCVRELHRAFSLKDNDLKAKIRDILCMLLEFDNAYRFRFQDLMGELNQEDFKKNSIKELLRLIDILSKRERTQEIRDTWVLVKMALKYYLKYDKELLEIVKEVFLEADIEKLKLSVEDKYYCKPRKDYNFGFIEKEKCQ